MRNIILTGFMGTGKSAVAAELSRLTGMKLIDIDHEIESAEGMSIADIFEQKGEPRFRDIESEAIRRIAGAARGAVISTGGGAVMRDENLDVLRQGEGVIVCLMASPETVYRRTCKSTHRPLLQSPDPRAKIEGLLELRMPRYELADEIVHTDNLTPREVADEILRRIKWTH